MIRIPTMLSAAALLSGCGLAETAATGAAAGTSAVEEARQAKQIEDKAKADIEAAQQQAVAARKAAEAAATESAPE